MCWQNACQRHLAQHAAHTSQRAGRLHARHQGRTSDALLKQGVLAELNVLAPLHLLAVQLGLHLVGSCELLRRQLRQAMQRLSTPIKCRPLHQMGRAEPTACCALANAAGCAGCGHCRGSPSTPARPGPAAPSVPRSAPAPWPQLQPPPQKLPPTKPVPARSHADCSARLAWGSPWMCRAGQGAGLLGAQCTVRAPAVQLDRAQHSPATLPSGGPHAALPARCTTSDLQGSHVHKLPGSTRSRGRAWGACKLARQAAKPGLQGRAVTCWSCSLPCAMRPCTRCSSACTAASSAAAVLSLLPAHQGRAWSGVAETEADALAAGGGAGSRAQAAAHDLAAPVGWAGCRLQGIHKQPQAQAQESGAPRVAPALRSNPACERREAGPATGAPREASSSAAAANSAAAARSAASCLACSLSSALLLEACSACDAATSACTASGLRALATLPDRMQRSQGCQDHLLASSPEHRPVRLASQRTRGQAAVTASEYGLCRVVCAAVAPDPLAAALVDNEPDGSPDLAVCTPASGRPDLAAPARLPPQLPLQLLP